jgi:hypothetical protein
LIGLALGLVALLGGALIFRAWLFKHPDPVDINSVIDDFANRTTIPETSIDQGLLAEGVYLYDTVGYEGIKGRISTRNTYTDVTPITVRWTECGFDFRWDAMSTRWDEVSICLEDRGLYERQTTEQHEFFRVTETRTYKCDDDALLVPSAAVKGDTWQATCTDVDAHTDRTTSVVGVDAIDVGGIAVETIHIGLDQVLKGSAVGSARIDYWFRQSDGLIVKYEKNVSAERDTPIGAVTYTEEVSIKLQSLVPITAKSK